MLVQSRVEHTNRDEHLYERPQPKELQFSPYDLQKKQKDVAAVNRTRGSCMASTNFTTKPLRL
jgi:hypothetical protein